MFLNTTWLAIILVVALAAWLAWRNIAVASGAPAAGDEAPGFSLQDQDGVTRSLEDFRGKALVLYFCPRADTPG